MFGVEPLRSPCGHMLGVSLTCTNTSVAAISYFLCLWFTMSCTVSVFGIATQFQGIFTVCKFAFVIWCFLGEYSVFL